MEIVLYRQLLRASRTLERKMGPAGGLSRDRELRRFLPFLPSPVRDQVVGMVGEQPHHNASGGDDYEDDDCDGALSLPHLLRTSFANGGGNVDRAFGALRKANTRLASVSADSWVAKPLSVQFDVGQVFKHKKYGFRGVIFEWYVTAVP